MRPYDIDLPALLPAASGQVTTTAGTAIPGVSIQPSGYYAGTDGWNQQVESTDASGGFALNQLGLGSSVVVGVNRQSGQSLYTGRYYAGPGSLGSATAAGATPVTGMASPQDLGTVELDTCGTVSGHVASSLLDSRLYPTVFVFNDADPGVVTRSAAVATTGSFAVTGLLPGSYYAVLHTRDASDVVVETALDGVTPGSGSPNVTIAASCAAVDGVDFGVPAPGGSGDQTPGSGSTTGGTTGADAPGAEPAWSPAEPSSTQPTSGGVSVPAQAQAGSTVTVQVGADHAGEDVVAYLFSTPVFLGRHTVAADGTITVTLPSGVTGNHRIAVYTASGQLIGWDSVRIVASRGRLAATGAVVGSVLASAAVLLLGGAVLLGVRRRRLV